MDSIRVLIADRDLILARRLAEHISAHGFDVRTAANGVQAREILSTWKPRFVVADYLLQGGNAVALIQYIRDEPSLRRNFVHVLVTSAHNDAANVRQAIDQGAKDYIVKPFTSDDLLKRLIFHARVYRKSRPLSDAAEAQVFFRATEQLVRTSLQEKPLEDILRQVVTQVNARLNGVRTSLVHCLDQKEGRVVVSHDAQRATSLVLDLYRYPEIVHVLNTQTTVAVDNLRANKQLGHIVESLQEVDFNALVVCPVKRLTENFGVLSVRLPEEKATLTDDEIRFVELGAQVISLLLAHQGHRALGEFWRRQTVRPLPRRVRKIS